MSGVASPKPEFPPLLAASGRHAYTVDDLKAICVDGFPHSTSRKGIFDELARVIDKTRSVNIRGELWIDGGFLTQSINPKDVDFVLRFDSDDYDAGTMEQKQVIDWIVHDLWKNGICDSYAFPEYPTAHPLQWLTQDQHDYWMKWFGKSRRGEVKGIAVIKFP